MFKEEELVLFTDEELEEQVECYTDLVRKGGTIAQLLVDYDPEFVLRYALSAIHQGHVAEESLENGHRFFLDGTRLLVRTRQEILQLLEQYGIV